MKLVNNNAKKLFAIAALAALTLCNAAQGMITDVGQINAINIRSITVNKLKKIIDQQPGIFQTLLGKSRSKISKIRSFEHAITQDNFHLLDRELIRYLLDTDRTLGPIFASYVNKENIQHIHPDIIYALLKADKSLAQTFASYVNKENIQQTDSLTFFFLLHADSSLAQIFASYITKENIQDVDPNLMQLLLKADNSLGQTFASYITKANFIACWQAAQVLIELYPPFTKKVDQLLQAKNPQLQKNVILLNNFLWNPQMLKKYLDIQAKYGISSSKKNSLQGYSHQHFATTYEAVLDMFSDRLKQDPSLAETLFKAVAREELELKNGRYTIAHGRRSNRFVRDQVWLWLKEIESKKPIDRTSWYPMHWKTNGKSMPYKNTAEVITHGRGSTEDRKSVQFASDLFGCKGGSSALDYVLRNDNVDKLSTQETSKQLFGYFGWEKYYHLGAKYFERAEKLAAQMKYGTLLLYSFTTEALEKFAFVTHKSGAGKGDITLLTSDGQEFRTNSPKVVLDTLLHNPNNFKDQSKKYEYVIAVCDDDTKDPSKLGTQNPFNQELRTYHFNFGDDKKLATEIKRLVAAGFMQILSAMVKDEVITKELACELIQANPLFKQKSRL